MGTFPFRTPHLYKSPRLASSKTLASMTGPILLLVELVRVLATPAQPIDNQPSLRVRPPVSRVVCFLSLAVFSPSQIGSCPIITLSIVASRLANSPFLVGVTIQVFPRALSGPRELILGSSFLLSFLSRELTYVD